MENGANNWTWWYVVNFSRTRVGFRVASNVVMGSGSKSRVRVPKKSGFPRVLTSRLHPHWWVLVRFGLGAGSIKIGFSPWVFGYPNPLCMIFTILISFSRDNAMFASKAKINVFWNFFELSGSEVGITYSFVTKSVKRDWFAEFFVVILL